jgi:hypothetical protein
MRYTTYERHGTKPPWLSPALSPPFAMWLEFEAPEETQLRNLEIKISEARRNGEPTEALVEEHRRTYEAWILRVDREIQQLPPGSDRGRLPKQRERAIREYNSMYPPARKMQ